jgi:hypothetical protein
VIDDPKGFDFAALSGKSASIHFEFMFSRSSFETPDIARQHEILGSIADLVDAGTLHTTMTRTSAASTRPICAGRMQSLKAGEPSARSFSRGSADPDKRCRGLEKRVRGGYGSTPVSGQIP